MLLERSEILAQTGKEDEFAAVLADKAVPVLAAFPGVASAQWGRGVENPDKFALHVVWDNMDAHIAFTTSPEFGAFRALLMGYSRGGAMEHFEMC